MSDYLKEGRAAARRLLEGYGDLGQGTGRKRRKAATPVAEAAEQEGGVAAEDASCGNERAVRSESLEREADRADQAGDVDDNDDDYAPDPLARGGTAAASGLPREGRRGLAVMIAIARPKPTKP